MTKNHFLRSSQITVFKQNHMTDLSIIISFTRFHAYYVNLCPDATEKTSRVHILFFTYFSNISQCCKIWGTCQFLGTTMLFFEKFIIFKNHFIPLLSSQSKQKRRYVTLKFGEFAVKFRFFTPSFDRPIFSAGQDVTYCIDTLIDFT